MVVGKQAPRGGRISTKKVNIGYCRQDVEEDDRAGVRLDEESPERAPSGSAHTELEECNHAMDDPGRAMTWTRSSRASATCRRVQHLGAIRSRRRPAQCWYWPRLPGIDQMRRCRRAVGRLEMRCAGAVLLGRPDVLLMDEPTNPRLSSRSSGSAVPKSYPGALLRHRTTASS